MKKITIVFLLVLCSYQLGAQRREIFKRGKNDTLPVAVVVYEGEYIPWITSKEIAVSSQRKFASDADKQAYGKLRRNVLKVLPYARKARLRYQKLERDLAITVDEGKQKKLVKDCELEIRSMFSQEIKQLTISQGKVLIKLIDRETHHTSYELVKELKGTMSAFFFQSIAKLFGHDLKTEYNPEEERDIEAILASVGYNSLQ